MNRFLSGVARAVGETFDLPTPIVEVGSYQVDGQESYANLRALFPHKEFIGVDVRPGPGVDCVADVEALPHADGSVGTVIAMSTFEHVPHFWKGFEEVRRVLRPDGVFIVSCPFHFHIHNYPNDYWRFTPEAFQLLLKDYPQKIVGWHGPKTRPVDVWAIAFREQHEPITPGQYENYKVLLDRYAHEPQRWRRKLRYRLGRLLCGRGPFAPYLDHNRWETECLSSL
jgi:SAM-dependent methyltransferase